MDDPNIEKRTASGIAVNLSSYLITGALAMVGAQAVVVTFVFDKRDHLTLFYAVTAITFILLIASIYFGGKGIDELIEEGYKGGWLIHSRHGEFNMQSLCILAGAVLLAISATLGTPKESAAEKEIATLNATVVQMAGQIQTLGNAQRNDRSTIEQLKSAAAAKARSSTGKSTKGKRTPGR
jgi:cell division protein FtsB